MPESQIIVQRDGQILVTPGANQAELAVYVRACAQLDAIVAGSYRFRISPVALWGSAARGLTVETILDSLDRHAATPLPAAFAATVVDIMSRYGRLCIVPAGNGRSRVTGDRTLLTELGIEPDAAFSEPELARLRLELAGRGWPLVDRRGLDGARRLGFSWRESDCLRPYQRAAVGAFVAAGSGVVLLPCGAGKTVVGVGAAVECGGPALILVPSTAIAEQWKRALLEMTTLREDQVVVWSRGARPAPVTIATYHAASGGAMRAALETADWRLAIYDEVQSLPADMFRLVAAISAPRRLGLSATLVREDGREAEVFGMVGPVVYDVPWMELEQQGWIAPARCYEVRIPAAATPRDRLRYKAAVVERLLASHRDEPTLVVGSNVPMLTSLARRFDLPLLTGKTETAERERCFAAFRDGQITRLAISRIGSVGLDLPAAKVMIQVSGNFGSRQEEAQRLGRLLRPSDGQTAHFYSLVLLGTQEETYARRRQRFLIDQGYQYEIIDAANLPRPDRQFG